MTKINKPKQSELEKAKEKKIEKGLEFIESFQNILFDKDKKTVPISLRIPVNILRVFKYRAEQNNQKYQSLLVEYLRQGLKAEYEKRNDKIKKPTL